MFQEVREAALLLTMLVLFVKSLCEEEKLPFLMCATKARVSCCSTSTCSNVQTHQRSGTPCLHWLASWSSACPRPLCQKCLHPVSRENSVQACGWIMCPSIQHYVWEHLQTRLHDTCAVWKATDQKTISMLLTQSAVCVGVSMEDLLIVCGSGVLGVI